MNVIIGVANPMLETMLTEFAGRSVTGLWDNPGMEIVDLKCSDEEYQDLKTRPGVTLWGAWDNGKRVEARPDLSTLYTGRTLNTVHKWFGDEDKQ